MSLQEIQQQLRVPKNQYNTFGGYNYRSCEDILEAVKPLLGSCILTLSDEMVCIGDRYYVRATATLIDGDKTWTATAHARESLTKKGMDDSQITGTASSYARKYALNGLFLIDDNKDADTDSYQRQTQEPKSAGKATPKDNAPPPDDAKVAEARLRVGEWLMTTTDGKPDTIAHRLTDIVGQERRTVAQLSRDELRHVWTVMNKSLAEKGGE